MNKIILFCLLVVIGAVLSSDVYVAPTKNTGDVYVAPSKPSTPKISNNDFSCTLKAIKVCGSDDSKTTNDCLKQYMLRCEKESRTTTVTKEVNESVVNKHKTHHTFKTSIIVKEKSSLEFTDAKRICITDSNCNCKTIAKNKCSEAEDPTSCYDENLKTCQTRCNRSRRCYRMDCKRAGHKRCTKNAELECAILHSGRHQSEARFACIQKKSQCCKTHERATCFRARRVYKFRTECTIESQRKCSNIVDEDTKCSCVSQTRHECLVKKVESYRQSVRQVFDCNDAAALLCTEKKCGTAMNQCLKKELSICEPVCVKESRQKCNNQANGPCYTTAYKACVHKWKRKYCIKRAEIACGDDNECVRGTIELCKRDIPTCMTGEVSCDDKNKCTEDRCDPKLGCINKPINCDDKNACTTESCDPLLGCVYKTKKCDDGIQCTRDSCNVVTGQCKHVFETSLSPVCKTSPCKVDTDCAAWEKSQHLAESCESAKCNLKTGACVRVARKNCATKCRKSCQPYHACDEATCVLNKNNGQYDCVHKDKDCNDNRSCTIDSCDKKLGCQHKLNTDKCPSHPICKRDSECVAWGTTKNLKSKCQSAKCDIKRGICVAQAHAGECDEEVCAKNCIPRNKCENAKCIRNGQTGRSFCRRTPVICDDKKDCTVDSCDNTLGCVFKYKVSEVCKPGAQCVHNADCATYGIINKLEKECKVAVCDPKLGACKAVLKDKPCKKITRECRLDCFARHQCERAACVKNSISGEFECKRTAKSCDDGKSCTVDVCHQTRGCVSTYRPNQTTCPLGGECKNDSDCIKFGIKNRLSRQCKRAVCNKTTGACDIIPKAKKCVTKDICKLTCAAANQCETASCELNDEGDFFCKRVSRTCDDKNKCTLDICDRKTGQCTFTQLNTPECTTTTTNKCKTVNDCKNWATQLRLESQCKTAVCDDLTLTCKSVPTTDKSCEAQRICNKDCQARNACETASCKFNQTTGVSKCVRTPVPNCKPTKECDIPCVAANPCESAVCVAKPTGGFECKRTVNTCDDKKSCTVDSCDIKTGKCVNTYTPNKTTCPPKGVCDKNIDCKQWALDNELDNCLTAVCDKDTGACKAVSNGYDCSSKTCDVKCPPKNKCEKSFCKYDSNLQLVCQARRKTCDDNNVCTRDSCDPNVGCVHTQDLTLDPKCKFPVCKDKVDCVKFAQDNKLADNCQEAVCDARTKTCQAILINNEKCNPDMCRKQCNPRSKCETATCITDPATKQFTCERKPITCNDNNPCTADVCLPESGCKYTYTVSDKCEKFCKDNVDCGEYGLVKEADLDCKIPVCDKTTTSCKLIDNPDKTCEPIRAKCNLMCKKNDNCDTVKCKRVPKTNKHTCEHKAVECNDGKDCTVDSCDKVKGCVFTFKQSKTCTKQCDKDIDCASWATENKLDSKCLKAKCNKKLGSCVITKGVQTEKCKTTDVCKVTSDCPQDSRYGSICCTEGANRQCCEHECETDLDCPVKDKKKQWGYCIKTESGRRRCKPRDRCTGNEGCDDKNPCTKDICLTEYGFCKWVPRCKDNSECTTDICEASADGRSYTCKNKVKSCTNDKKLLDKDYSLLSKEQQSKWLGKCSHLEGCITCVVNAQCDDNNGCTEDSCENQFCVSKPIDNKWCDPKLVGQAITVQGYFPKFTRL